MEDFKPLLDLLSGQFGWIAGVVVWIGALRVPMRIISGRVQIFLTRFVASVVASKQTDDDAALRRIIGSLWYRFLAFTLDALISLKLPTSDSLDEHQMAVSQARAQGRGYFVLIGGLMILFSTACATRAQTIGLAWNSVPGATSYRVGIGSTNGNYPLTQTVVNTNAIIDIGSLAVGINFISVSVKSINNSTSAVVTVWSAPVIVTRLTEPALRLSVSVDTSTNLIVWNRGGLTADAIVSADRSMEFFRPHVVSLTRIGDESPPDESSTAVNPPPLPR